MAVAGMSNFRWQEFSSRDALDRQLAEDVAVRLSHAISARGAATLVVSGGSTPRGFFALLSLQPIRWSAVTVLLADERWLPGDHPDSNEKLVKDCLLVNDAAAASFISLTGQGEDAVTAAAGMDKMLAALAPFDVVILGMGEDGHTASLFPQAANIAEGLALDSGKTCIAVAPVTAPYQRISMTLPRLLNAAHVIIHITGNTKKALLESARIARDQQQLPINAVVQQSQTPVTVYWAA